MAETQTPADIIATMTVGQRICFPFFADSKANPGSITFAPAELHSYAALGLASNVVEYSDRRSNDRIADATLTNLGRAVAAALAA
jgi:hypothetical protein